MLRRWLNVLFLCISLIVFTILSAYRPVLAATVPTAVNDRAIIYKPNTVVEIHPLLNDSDPAGGKLRIKSWTGVKIGKLSAWGDGFLYEYLGKQIPATDSFTYTVVNSKGETATATVAIELYQTYSPPSLTPDEITIFAYKFTRLNVLQNDSDPAAIGTNLPLRLTDLGRTRSNESGKVEVWFSTNSPDTVSLRSNFAGTETIDYWAKSTATGLISQGTLTVHVVMPRPPIAPDYEITAKAGRPTVIYVKAVEPDPSDLFVRLRTVEGAVKGKVRKTYYAIEYTPNRDASGDELLTYTVELGGVGIKSSGKVMIHITP